MKIKDLKDILSSVPDDVDVEFLLCEEMNGARKEYLERADFRDFIYHDFDKSLIIKAPV